jgi:hypothetical protein
MNQAPVCVSDEAATQICQMARTLEPPAQLAFMAALAAELRDELPPVGDGVVCRRARALLRTGRYQRAGAFVLDTSIGRNLGAHHYKPRAKRI